MFGYAYGIFTIVLAGAERGNLYLHGLARYAACVLHNDVDIARALGKVGQHQRVFTCGYAHASAFGIYCGLGSARLNHHIVAASAFA